MTATRRPRADRRAEAIGHGADLLREFGPNGLTSVAVADRMGLSQSAIYRHVRDMDELASLSSAAVVDGLNAELQSILLTPGIDWESLDDVARLCRQLVDGMARTRRSFEVVDRWRFATGELGSAIRDMVQQAVDLIAILLEARWRSEYGHTEPLSADARAAQRWHAQLIYDDSHAIARLVRGTPRRGGRAAVADLLRFRIIGEWFAYVIDLQDRIGRPV